MWPTRLMHYVELAGITGRAWRWIYAFTTHRRIRTVDTNHQSAWQSLTYGVSQGAVLSPLLFNLFINPVAKRIATACPRLNLQLYADDMVIQPKAAKLVNGLRQHQGVASHNAVHTLFNIDLVHAFRLLNTWCDETRMRFGQDKTQWVVFDKRLGPFADKDYSRYRQYTLCGFSPEVVEEYKYLGVTHHRQLDWNTQSVAALQRIRRDSHLVLRLIHPSRAPHFPAIRAMCMGYVRARCLYAWAFWEPKPAQTRAMQAAFIHPMQRVFDLHSTSHHLGLLVEANCPSFEALRTQAAARFMLRAEALLLSDPQHPTARALLQDRARAAVFHCRGHVKARIPVTRYADATAIPHLLHEVLAHLPTLAPHHALTARYFPSQPSAATPPLPTALTITTDDVNSLLMVDTHREWRAPPTLRGGMQSTAPLLSIKTSPTLSLFLRHETNPMVGIRARIRANRTHTQLRRYRIRQVQDPSCTFPACRQSAPFYLDSIEHMLLACPRHQAARQQLLTALAPHSFPHAPVLTVAFLSGEVSEPSPTKLSAAQLQHAVLLLHLTATFLTQVSQDRQEDPDLRTLHFTDQEERAPY